MVARFLTHTRLINNMFPEVQYMESRSQSTPRSRQFQIREKLCCLYFIYLVIRNLLVYTINVYTMETLYGLNRRIHTPHDVSSSPPSLTLEFSHPPFFPNVHTSFFYCSLVFSNNRSTPSSVLHYYIICSVYSSYGEWYKARVLLINSVPESLLCLFLS